MKSLEGVLRLAESLQDTRDMTPGEIRAQRISFIVAQTSLPREKVAEWLDKHEGRSA